MEINRLVSDRIQAMLAPGAPTFLSTFVRGLIGSMTYADPVLDVGCRLHSLCSSRRGSVRSACQFPQWGGRGEGRK